MPSIRVRALPQPPSVDLSSVMAELRDHVAATLVAPADGVRVLWHTLEPGHYLEAGDTPAVQPSATHPPTIELVAFEGRSPAQIEQALTGLAAIIVQHLELEPGNAWVSYVEAAEGELYVQGAIKRHAT